jgi:hypothetical protein
VGKIGRPSCLERRVLVRERIGTSARSGSDGGFGPHLHRQWRLCPPGPDRHQLLSVAPTPHLGRLAGLTIRLAPAWWRQVHPPTLRGTLMARPWRCFKIGKLELYLAWWGPASTTRGLTRPQGQARQRLASCANLLGPDRMLQVRTSSWPRPNTISSSAVGEHAITLW